MGENLESLMRRGAISGKQAGKSGLKRAATVNKGDGDGDFDSKDGARDQGAGRDRGDRVASKDHINRSDKNERGMPSKGARVNKGGQFGRDQIDDGEYQAPEFPKGGSNKRKVGVTAPGKSSGPQYGGPSSRRDG
jgi:hypothetical protein